MAYLSRLFLAPFLLLSKSFVMLTGPLTQVTGKAPLVLQSSLVQISSPGGLKSNKWWPGPAQKLSIEALLKQQLIFFGFKPYSRNYALSPKFPQSFVTISLQSC